MHSTGSGEDFSSSACVQQQQRTGRLGGGGGGNKCQQRTVCRVNKPPTPGRLPASRLHDNRRQQRPSYVNQQTRSRPRNRVGRGWQSLHVNPVNHATGRKRAAKYRDDRVCLSVRAQAYLRNSRRHCFSRRTLHHSVRLCDRL